MHMLPIYLVTFYFWGTIWKKSTFLYLINHVSHFETFQIQKTNFLALSPFQLEGPSVDELPICRQRHALHPGVCLKGVKWWLIQFIGHVY